MTVDSFSNHSSDVLAELDPLERALLDLSIKRGMGDAEIADVLGSDQEAVLEVREGLLRNLAVRVAPEAAEQDLATLEALVAERLYGEDAAAAEALDLGDEVDAAEIAEADAGPNAIEDDRPTGTHAVVGERDGESDAAPEAEADPEPHAERPSNAETDDRPTRLHAVPDWSADAESQPASAPVRRRRSPLVTLLPALLLVVLVAAVALIASGDGDGAGDPGPGGEPAATAPQPPAEPKPEPRPQPPAEPKPEPIPGRARLTPLAGAAGAEATASLEGDRLRLTISGLPDPGAGSYEVWLYDSVIDARSLGRFDGTRAELDLRLPGDAGRYRYIDVSREPADDNPNHSGRSVLRVPLAELTKQR